MVVEQEEGVVWPSISSFSVSIKGTASSRSSSSSVPLLSSINSLAFKSNCELLFSLPSSKLLVRLSVVSNGNSEWRLQRSRRGDLLLDLSLLLGWDAHDHECASDASTDVGESSTGVAGSSDSLLEEDAGDVETV